MNRRRKIAEIEAADLVKAFEQGHESPVLFQGNTGLRAGSRGGGEEGHSRGSGHPAKLNFGDYFAYALAAAMGEPLLAKGEEFKRAGLKLALD